MEKQGGEWGRMGERMGRTREGGRVRWGGEEEDREAI